MQRSEESRLLNAGLGPHRSGLHFLFLSVVVALHFFCRAVQFPITFAYIFNYISAAHNTSISAQHPCAKDNSTVVQKEVQKEVANLDKYLQLAMFLPALVPTILLGSLVDRIGRRLGLLLPHLGLLLRQILVIVIITGSLNPYFLLVPIAVEALSGGFATMLLVSFGIVADLTEPGKTRTFRISVIEAVQTVATSIGSYASSQIIQNSFLSLPLTVTTVFSAFMLLVVWAYFPETLRHQEPFSCRAMSPRACVRVYSQDTMDERRGKLLLALAAFFLVVAVNFSSGTLSPLYLEKEPLCWSQLHVNIFLSVKIVAHWLLLLLFVKGMLRLLHLHDTDIGILGCISSLVAAVLMAFANKDAFVYTAAVVGVGMRAVIPMIRSFMSNLIYNEEQGALFAGLGCVEVLMAAVSGYVTYMIYQSTLDFFSGLIYMIFAVINIFIIILLLVLRCHSRPRRSDYEPLPSSQSASIQSYDDSLSNSA